MSSISPAIKNGFLTLGIGTFLFMSLFGVFHMGMAKSIDGKMDACPSMPGVKVCFPTHLEHASYMQGLFTNIPQEENSLRALLFSLALVVVVRIVWSKKLFMPSDSNLRVLQHFYTQRSFSIPRYLQELFSNGILNPKFF